MVKRSNEKPLADQRTVTPTKLKSSQDAAQSFVDGAETGDVELTDAAVDALNRRYRPKGPSQVRSSL